MIRLGRRGLVLSTLLATLLQGGAAGVAHWWRSESDRAVAIEQEQLAVAQRRHAARAEQVSEPELERVAPQWQLFESPDAAATLQRVSQLGLDAHVVFDVMKAPASSTTGKEAFQVAGRGTPQSVCEFLASIERCERLMIVESGRFLPGGEGEVAFELAIATYHRGGGR